jgi:hypothetical protein
LTPMNGREAVRRRRAIAAWAMGIVERIGIL